MLGRRAETIVGRQGAEAATSTRRSSAIVDNAPRALIGSSCLPLLPDDAAYLFGRNRIAEARGHTNFLVRSCSPIGGDGHRIDKRHRPIPAISNIIGRRRKRYNRFRPSSSAPVLPNGEIRLLPSPRGAKCYESRRRGRGGGERQGAILSVESFDAPPPPEGGWIGFEVIPARTARTAQAARDRGRISLGRISSGFPLICRATGAPVRHYNRISLARLRAS